MQYSSTQPASQHGEHAAMTQCSMALRHPKGQVGTGALWARVLLPLVVTLGQWGSGVQPAQHSWQLS